MLSQPLNHHLETATLSRSASICVPEVNIGKIFPLGERNREIILSIRSFYLNVAEKSFFTFVGE